MKIISLFSGCGGLDLGFKKAGYKIIWANDNDSKVWETYKNNFPETNLDKRSIIDIPSKEIPNEIDGIIGGPPCQSWSIAGNGKGIDDPRGKLFLEFVRVVKDKTPKFFLAENVLGILNMRHNVALNDILDGFDAAGYTVKIIKVNAKDFGVPQNRKRVFFVGFKKSLNIEYDFSTKPKNIIPVINFISDLKNNAKKPKGNNYTNGLKCAVPNHEYWVGTFSYIFMSRNRVLDWDKPSFTLQASGRQTPLHPKAPPMEVVKKDVMTFNKKHENKYRRLTIRECARIQTFPDDFIFYYKYLNDGYKLVGNAVPVKLANLFAKNIKEYLLNIKENSIITKYGFKTSKTRSKLMSKIKSKDTRPEIILRKAIWNLGYRYSLKNTFITGKPDIVFKEKKVAVFVDGEFWHGYNWKAKKSRIKSNKDYWTNKIEKTIQRDKKNTVILSKSGWIVLRFWEKDIDNDLKKCLNKIVKILK